MYFEDSTTTELGTSTLTLFVNGKTSKQIARQLNSSKNNRSFVFFSPKLWWKSYYAAPAFTNQCQKENIFNPIGRYIHPQTPPWLWFSVSQILPNGKSIGWVKMEEESWAKSYQQIESSVNCNCGLIYFRHQLMLVNLEIRPLHFQSHFQHCKELALRNELI